MRGLVPALFKQTASSKVEELYDCMCVQRDEKAMPAVENFQI